MWVKKLSAVLIVVPICSGSVLAGAPTPYDNWVIEEGVIYSGKKDDLWLGATASGALAPEAVPNGIPEYLAPSTTPTGGFSCDDTNITCKVLVQDDGFLYEEIKFSAPLTGIVKTYLRTIVVDDTNLTGDYNPSNVTFSSESYVPFAVAGPESFDQGVAVKQVVRDSQDEFLDVSEIQKGMLRLDPNFYFHNLTDDPAGPIPELHPNSPPTPADDRFTTKLHQSFRNDTTGIASSFDYTNYTAYETNIVPRNPDSNNRIGQDLRVAQTVILGDNETPTDSDATKRQAFVYAQATGLKGTGTGFGGFFPTNERDYMHSEDLTTAGNLTVERFANDFDGSAVSWADGNDISVTWIAATELAEYSNSKTVIGLPGEPCPAGYSTCSINTNNEPEIPTPAPVGFAYQRVNNNSTGATGEERYLEFTEGTLPADLIPISYPLGINPFGWDNNFGDAPVF